MEYNKQIMSTRKSYTKAQNAVFVEKIREMISQGIGSEQIRKELGINEDKLNKIPYETHFFFSYNNYNM